MRTFIIRLLLVSVSMIAATLQAQNITFNHLTTDDGLSQFSVNSLYIDENGVLWIGTREGLNRYDGEDIQTYKLQKNDPYSLFCNTVLRMAGNRNGKIYLLCTEGVAEFNLATQRFTTLLQGNVHSIYSVAYITKRPFSSENRMKSTAITSRPGTLTSITSFPEKVWKSAVCIWTKDKCGLERPPTEHTACNWTRTS